MVNDFTDPNLVLDQNHFIAQVNTLYTNTTVTRANQLWIRGFANAGSQLLFSRIFCSWMCENSLSHENREGRHRCPPLQGHETVLFCLKLYGFPHPITAGAIAKVWSQTLLGTSK